MLRRANKKSVHKAERCSSYELYSTSQEINTLIKLRLATDESNITIIIQGLNGFRSTEWIGDDKYLSTLAWSSAESCRC
jgi:hypothetical protein